MASKTLSRLSLLTHDRKESSAYNEGEQYQSVVFNRALPSLYQKLMNKLRSEIIAYIEKEFP